MDTGQTRGDVGFDLHDFAFQPTHRDRERSAQRHQPTPCTCVISGLPLPADADADDIDAHRRPAVVLAGQPQPGQPTQPADLLRRHRLLHPTELVTGAGLHLDENYRAGGLVGGDDVELAVPAAPIAVQHLQSDRRQVINSQLLTQRTDFGTSP